MTLIKYKINPKSAQSIIEYALLLGICIIGLVAGMQFIADLVGSDPQRSAFTNHFDTVRSYICY